MKKTKIINLMCLSLILFFSLIIGVNKSAKVYAETANAETAGAETETTETAKATFEMVYGASIRIGEGQVNGKDMTNGLRFQVKMDETTAKSIDGTAKKLYVLIVPAVIVDLTSDAQIEAHKSAIVSYKEKWIPVAVDSIYESVAENGKNYYFANAMICNLTSDFYGVKFNAVAIIEESGEYTYAKASSAARSIYDVVNSAVLDVYADKIIGSEVAANTKLDYAKWYGTEEYPVAPKTPAQFNKYNELKSTTLKNLSIERQDVMVNNPVVTIGGTEYDITVPEVHGEQDVEVTVEGATVTVPVTIIDDVITDFETFKSYTMYSTSESVDLKNKGKYFVLGGDIDAAGQSVSDYNNNGNATAWTEYGKGFAGTIDGRGFSVNNLEYEQSDTNHCRVEGLFGGLVGATVKDITFNISTFGGDNGNFSLFGWNIKDSTFKNVTINIPETCAANLQKGGFFAVQNNDGKFYDVTVNAPGTTILYLLGSGSRGQYATTENVVVDAEEVKYIYGSVTSKQGVIAPRVVTLTGNQNILMTNETYSLDLGDETNGLTVTAIICDGENLGTNLSNLDLSAFKSDYAKHGEKTIVVKGVKGDSKIKITVPVTFVTKMIGTVEDLRGITKNPNDSTTKSVFGYYKLSENLDCTADWAGFSNDNPNGFSWANANNGFRGTLDGNGKTITGFAHSQGLFYVLGNGAVIKNINFVSTKWSGSDDRLFGIASYGATFENVNIVMKGDSKQPVPSNHLLFAEACQNNSFKNVTLKVYSDNGSTLAGLSTVFGKNFTGNTCKGVKIYCASITELGKDSSSNSVTQYDGIEIYNTEE